MFVVICKDFKTLSRRTSVQHWQGIFLDWQSNGAWMSTEWIKEIQSICDKQDPDHQSTCWCMGQWQYVASKDNPADHTSRGTVGNKRHKIYQWFNGPILFWKDTHEWPPSAKIPEVDSNNDPEIKRVGVVCMVGQKQDTLSILESWVFQERCHT